jgi:hypothetical protein
MQNDDFAAKVSQPNGSTVRVLEREIRCVLVEGLEVFLFAVKLVLQTLQRVGRYLKRISKEKEQRQPACRRLSHRGAPGLRTAV